MKKKRVAAAFVVFSTCLVPVPAFSQETYTLCAETTRTVHEISSQLALHDFDGVGQMVAGAAYSYSRCLGSTGHRLRFEAAYNHVEEEGSPFRADALVAAAGVELRPFAEAPGLAIVPMLRAGQERFRGDLHNTVLGGSVIVSYAAPIGPAPEIDTRDHRSHILVDFRADYTDRRSSDLALLSSDGGRATFYGAIGLDQRIGRGRWRWTARAAYQLLEEGPIGGYGQVLLSVRRLDRRYEDYPWNAQIGFNLGDEGYRAALFIFSLRFSAGARP